MNNIIFLFVCMLSLCNLSVSCTDQVRDSSYTKSNCHHIFNEVTYQKQIDEALQKKQKPKQQELVLSFDDNKNDYQKLDKKIINDAKKLVELLDARYQNGHTDSTQLSKLCKILKSNNVKSIKCGCWYYDIARTLNNIGADNDNSEISTSDSLNFPI